MKIVNDKGKLFGIINVIDLAIILVVLALGLGIVVKLGSTESNKPNNEKSIDFNVTVLCRGVEGKVAENLKEGDQVVYGNLYVNGYIVSVTKLPAKEYVVSDDGTVKEVIIPDLSNVEVVMKIIYDGNDDLIMLGKYQVNIGKNLVVKTHRVEVTGIVQDIIQS